MNWLRQGFGTFSFVALLGSPVLAAAPLALLDQIHGKVLINQGHGYVTAAGQVDVQAGDRILIGKKSSVEVFYVAQNCSVGYAAPMVVTITAKTPCKAGEKFGNLNSVFANQEAFAPILPIVPPGGIGLLPLSAGLAQPVAGASAFYYTSFIVLPPPVSLP
jgi:hypothetical protein